MGPTDFDMYDSGGFPALQNLVRVDVDADQLARGPSAALSILSSAENLLADLLAGTNALPDRRSQQSGARRAEATRNSALASLSPAYRRAISLLDSISETLPGVIMVGDSTQPIYAGNLYCEISQPGGWFNSATGYGSLGYGPPAAIGAALAAPDRPIIAITGDGGFQFSLAELG